MSESTNIRVAVRIRPLLSKEKLERCSECVKPLSSTELVMMGKEKQFTFDYVFGQMSHQHDIYEKNVAPLVRSLFDGYNATVLAYGQTGSGKTYTMGTSSDALVDDDDSKLGVIPRAMSHIFDLIEERKEQNPGSEFYLRVQFLEIYGEDIRDLLDPAGSAEGKLVNIRETEKGIEVVGALEEAVKSTQAMYEALERGSLCRTTGSTQMNVHSSRSHAIFTIIVEQQLPAAENVTEVDGTSEQNPVGEQSEDPASPEIPSGEAQIEYRTAKFHFVDLAGSERAKRTGATGMRLKEGININKGLLALGNVISALGDDTKPKGTHVPYRDSKLTRMLQDSLGGNSRTLMIACVSPADANFEETLNALRYANRARNIKNKPVVNRDPNSSQIAMLKAQIAQLKLQLYGGNNGPTSEQAAQFSQAFAIFEGSGGNSSELHQEMEMAKMQAESAEAQVMKLTDAIEREKRARSELQEKYIMAAAQVDFFTNKYGEEVDKELVTTNADYLRRIEELQQQLEASDAELNQIRRELKHTQSEISFTDSLDDIEKEIVRNARVRKSLGGYPGSSSGLPSPVFEEDEDEDEVESFGEGESEVVIEEVTTEPELLEAHEEDDEVTKQLKAKFQKQQESFRKVVNSYDMTLKSKQLMMNKVVEERKKFEAMKLHYEAKMAEMNAEVQLTQQQRDVLDEKIKELETKKSNEGSKAQLTKLRLQLKEKNERLKSLEKQTSQLQEAKRMAAKVQQKEKRIQHEIDMVKKQKVDFQKKMEENAKKYREESQARRQEITKLRREKQGLANEKQKLKIRSDRDERLLKQKTEQVAAMQRKLRQAQRLTSHNKKLSEKEKKQRKQLEQWTKERIKRDEELERLQRALAKKQAAIERKEQLCRELEERKKTAEHRAKIAEETAAQVVSERKNADSPEPLSDSSGQTPDTKTEKQSIRSFFMPGSILSKTSGEQTGNEDGKNMAPDELEAIEELEQRLEAAEYEISFHKKQAEDAAANLPEEDEGENGEDQEGSVDKGKKANSAEAIENILPVDITSVEEAKSVVQELLQMYVDAKRSKSKLKQTIERLKSSSEEDARPRRRTSLIQAGQSSPAFVGTPGVARHSLGGNSPHGAKALRDKLGESSDLCKVLLNENQSLLKLLKEHGIETDANVELHLNKSKLQALEEQVKQLQVSYGAVDGTSGRRRRTFGENGTAVKERARMLQEEATALPTSNGPGFQDEDEDQTQQQQQNIRMKQQRRGPGVFDRLTNTSNFTGIHKRKIIDQKYRDPRENTLDELVMVNELEVDSLKLTDHIPESSVDGYTLDPGAVADVQRKSSIGQSPKSGDTSSSRRGSRSGSPSFLKMTESHANRRQQESMRRASKSRDSSGSTHSISEGRKTQDLHTETGTYKAEAGGLYRASNTASNGRARQVAWEAQRRGGKPSAGSEQSRQSAEKENTASPLDADAIPVFEKLSDPKNFTGVSKQKILEGSSDGHTPSDGHTLPDDRNRAMAQERLRRKNKQQLS